MYDMPCNFVKSLEIDGIRDASLFSTTSIQSRIGQSSQPYLFNIQANEVSQRPYCSIIDVRNIFYDKTVPIVRVTAIDASVLPSFFYCPFQLIGNIHAQDERDMILRVPGDVYTRLLPCVGDLLIRIP